jgi:hypothetical protein
MIIPFIALLVDEDSDVKVLDVGVAKHKPNSKLICDCTESQEEYRDDGDVLLTDGIDP